LFCFVFVFVFPEIKICWMLKLNFLLFVQYSIEMISGKLFTGFRSGENF
jgi:hypothetical protein